MTQSGHQRVVVGRNLIVLALQLRDGSDRNLTWIKFKDVLRTYRNRSLAVYAQQPAWRK